MITGAAGFCGPHLARRLRADTGVRIVGMSRRPPHSADAGIWDSFVQVDAEDPMQVARVLQANKPDWIFHLAGSFAGPDADLHAANVALTETLLAAVRAQVPEAAVLLVGSAAEYGSVALHDLPVRETQQTAPASSYGRTKLAATRLALAQLRGGGAKIRVARPFNIVGAGVPTSLVTGALIERIRRVAAGERPVVSVGNIDTQRDFVAVEDVVDAYVAMMRPECVGHIVNICSGRPCSIRTLIDVLRGITGHPIPIEVDPSLVRPGDVAVSYGSYEKAGALWGYMPKVSLEQALIAAWRRAATAAPPIRTSQTT